MNIITYVISQLFGSKVGANLAPLVQAMVDTAITANPTITLAGAQSLVNNNINDLVTKATAKVPGASIFISILVAIFLPQIDGWVASAYTKTTGRTS